jgi:hypothetical protein
MKWSFLEPTVAEYNDEHGTDFESIEEIRSEYEQEHETWRKEPWD